MTDLLEAIASPWNLLWLVLIFGVAPGFILRLLVKVYPPNDPRRRELIGQLYTLGRIERLLFVGEQFETVIFDGVSARRSYYRNRYSVAAKARLRHDRRYLLFPGLFFIVAVAGELSAILMNYSDLTALGVIYLTASTGVIGAIRLNSRLKDRRVIKQCDIAIREARESLGKEAANQLVSQITMETGLLELNARSLAKSSPQGRRIHEMIVSMQREARRSK